MINTSKEYIAEISRTNPSCFLFLIDQSGSMQDDLAGLKGKKKADELSTVINRLLQNLVIKCAKSEGVRDYYHVGVIGYGSNVGSAFSGGLSGKELASISEIANMPARVEERIKKEEDGAGGIIERSIKFPVWFDATANGGTPMCKAFSIAKDILTQWIEKYSNSFPPIVINITDGESSDGDPVKSAEIIKNLSTNDGNVLLFNVHLSSQNSSPIEFPDSEYELPDQYAKLLFQMSSVLPEYMRNIAKQEGYRVTDNTKGFTFNADMVSLIKFLDIGTRPSNLR